MWKKIIRILVCMLLITTIFPCVGASINETDEKENTIFYESRIFGIGFVYISKITHVIAGYVIFGINDGQVIRNEFIRIRFSEADEIFAGNYPPIIFYIRYNPK